MKVSHRRSCDQGHLEQGKGPDIPNHHSESNLSSSGSSGQGDVCVLSTARLR